MCESRDVADAGKDARGDDRADAGKVHQVRATGQEKCLELGGGLLDLGVDGGESSVSSSAARRRQVSPTTSRGGTETSRALACSAVMPFLDCPRIGCANIA